MYGDFDVVIQNANREKFKEMLKNNFYYYENNKCIAVNREKLNMLPPSFHLLIEIGIDVYSTRLEHKIKQIRKYISLINIRNIIKNDLIKKKYINDFERRLSLHLNSKNDNTAQTYVYMVISNSDLSSFSLRFLKNKLFQKDYNNEFEKICAIAPNEFICCGYVNFGKKLKKWILISLKKN